MDKAEFSKLVRGVFSRIMDAFDELDPDVVEADQRADFIEIVFADGACFVVSTQSAAHQIWLAAESRGWHFQYDSTKAAWISIRGGDELITTLQDLTSARLGQPFSI